MTSTSEQGATAGGRPITRADEGRVDAVLSKALGADDWKASWSATTGRLITILERGDGESFFSVYPGDVRLAEAGIVPGADGWWWAAPSPLAVGDRIRSRTTGRTYTAREYLADFTRYPGGPAQGPGWKIEDEEGMPAWETVAVMEDAEAWERMGAPAADNAPPPAWLTAAVLAALPVDGRPVNLVGVYAHVAEHPDYRMRSFAHVDAQCAAVLAALVASGEVEASFDRDGLATWRRWGVPEGWGWRPDGKRTWLCRIASEHPDRNAAACTFATCNWVVYRDAETADTICSGASATPESARTAALRACWTAGVFGPRPAVEGARVRLTADALVGGLAAPPPPRRGAVPAADLDAIRTDAIERPAPTRQAYDPTRIRKRLTALLANGPREAVDMFLDVLPFGAPEGFALPDLRTQLVAIGARMVDLAGEKWGLASGGVEAAPAAPDSARAEQVRQALLAVLTPGPLDGRSHVLAALDAAGGGLCVSSVEAAEAARAIGAVVDGARWALSEGPPPGWGWWDIGGLYLAPTDSQSPCNAAVASVVSSGLYWQAYPSGRGGRIVDEGEAEDTEASKVAALAAARRAGLFARPVAVVVTAVHPAPVEHVTAIVALARAIANGADASTLTSRLDAFASGVLDAALTRTIDHYATERARMLGGRPEDWRDMSEAGEGPGVEPPVGHCSPAPHAVVIASLAARAYEADAGLLYRVWQAAQRVREATAVAGDDPLDEAVGSLVAVLDAAEREGQTPRDPHPHRDGNEEPWETIERLARSLDETKRELEAMEVHGDEQRERAKRAEREAAEARSELAQLQAGLDGLRTWATGAKGVGK